MIEKEQLIRELTTITREVLAKAQLKAGDILGKERNYRWQPNWAKN